MRTLLALLLIPAAVVADDPPFVAAAKEREGKAPAFEVTLTVRKEWTGVTPIGTKERRDFAGTGTAKLAVDGVRFWYSLDVPQLTGMGDRLTRHRREMTFDGRQWYLILQFEAVNGERAGQFDTTYLSGSPYPMYPIDDLVSPIFWVFRGVQHFPPFVNLPVEGVDKVFQQAGRTDVIGGERCVEIRRLPPLPPGPQSDSAWLTAADHLPVRVGHVTIEYAAHPVLGRVPSGWTMTPTDLRGFAANRTGVTVDSLDLKDTIPNDRFRHTFPVGSRVHMADAVRPYQLVVAEDGSLVPEVKEPQPAPPAPPAPEPPTRTFQHTPWVVGGVVAVFVALVVLLRRLARNRTDDSPDSGDSPHLLT